MNTGRLLPSVRRLRRAHRSWARALLWGALLLAVTAAGGSVQAQAPEQESARAGIVVDFGDGVVQTACVDLGADGQATGEEMLAAAGFDVLIEYSPMGGAVCKIGPQGCDFPGQPCWCECMSSPCVYWSYNHLQNGQWLYSSLGASSYIVRAGDVEGWAWGAGTIAQGAAPPLRTFEQICAPAAPTDTPTATPTWTPWPTNTPPPSATPTWTPWPTDTPPPTATWTPVPTPTAGNALPSDTPTATPTWTPTATATWTPAPAELAAPSAPSPAQTDALAPSVQTPELVGLAGSLEPPAEAAVQVSPEIALDELSPTQAVVPAAVTDTPTPTATPQAVAAVAPAAAQPSVYRVSDPALPPRLDPSTGNAPARPASTALLTTGRPDYAPLALLIVALTAALGLGRAARRGRLLADVRGGVFSRPVTTETAEAVVTIGPAGSGGFSRPPARALSWAIYGLTAGIGLLALLHPFLTAALQPQPGAAGPVNTPLLMTVLVALCFLALLFEVQGQTVSAKLIALLGVLVAINSVLRFIEVSIPGPGGFTPVFFLIVLTGYVYGARFGFLMGALTLLVSAMITGGIGPWLPGQMFTAGWVGLLAPLALPLVRLAGGRAGSRRELAVLVLVAALAGLFYGLVINLWFWPFMIGPAEQYWQAGVTLSETVRRYAVYYLATSLLWDVFAVAGNVMLVIVFGSATLRALRRFQQRFSFEYEPENAAARAAPAAPVPVKRFVAAPGQLLQQRSGEPT